LSFSSDVYSFESACINHTSMAPKEARVSISHSLLLHLMDWISLIESSFNYYGLQFCVPIYGMPNALFASSTLPNLQIPSTLLFPFFGYFAKFTFHVCQCHYAKLSSPHHWSWIFMFAKLWGWRCQLHFMDEMFNQISCILTSCVMFIFCCGLLPYFLFYN
jgi:hypothetical protein